MRQHKEDWFGVEVVDEATGRGVPLVELETTNRVLFVTDSNGWAAIAEPGLMGSEAYFHVRSHGYSFAKDGFGYAGVRLKVTPGGRARIKLRRDSIAERVCRLTGEGIYRDSVLLGESVPLRLPNLAGQVVGQDSALAVVYKGQMLWFWGDTGRVGYPLGNFRTTGAMATFPLGQKSAARGLDYAYFTNADGYPRAMLLSDKPGPIWVGGTVVLQPKTAQETLVTHWSRMKNLETVEEQGYARWDETARVFRTIRTLPLGEKWRFLDGHPARWTEVEKTYWVSGFSYPTTRVLDSVDAFLDPANYEAFTCLNAAGEVQRDGRGAVIYGWQKDAPPLTSRAESDLIKRGKLRLSEAHFLPVDASGTPIVAHGGSVTWNAWRKKWLLIATRFEGRDSALGEIYYAEADAPTGPWRKAVKVVTHNRYTFYNPVHHPFLDEAGSRIIYFEGTYTAEFSGNPSPTPRYDYNQILYRLDLGDVRLPRPVKAGTWTCLPEPKRPSGTYKASQKREPYGSSQSRNWGRP